MFTAKAAFSSFSVNDLEKAKDFYTKIMRLSLEDETMGLHFALPGGGGLFVYEKADHKPATYTALNFVVDNIDTAVDELAENGVQFEHYDSEMKTDEKGIARGSETGMGPDIAWLKDPAGNFVAIMNDHS